MSVFPPFFAFLIIVSMGEIFIFIKIKSNKRRNNTTFKGKQRDNAKPSPHLLFSRWCINLKYKKTIGGGVKPACGND